MNAKARSTAVAAAALLVLAGCHVPGRAPAGLGPVRWRWRPPRPASVGRPAADTDGAVVTYSHTVVVSLTPDGRVAWEARRLGVREETPMLTAAMAVVPADDGLVAVDRATGRIRWDTKLGDTASTPIIAGNFVVACTGAGSLVAVDAGSGVVVWQVPLRGRADGPPATDGRTVVATWQPEKGDDGGITAVDLSTGGPRWTASLRAGGISGPAVVRGPTGRMIAVAVDDDLAAKAFDLDTGHASWTARVGGAGEPEVPPLPLPGGRVLVADRDADLNLFDVGGKRLWSAAGAGAAVSGAPAGPGRGGDFALVLYSGKLQLAGPGHTRRIVEEPGGLANGAAVSPDRTLLLSTAQGDDNQLVAYRGPP
jgi:outer membrane protein assembly factor BamB